MFVLNDHGHWSERNLPTEAQAIRRGSCFRTGAADGTAQAFGLRRVGDLLGTTLDDNLQFNTGIRAFRLRLFRERQYGRRAA